MEKFDDILNNTPEQKQNSNPDFNVEEWAAAKKAERDGLYALADSTATDVVNDGIKFRQYMDVQSRFDRTSAVNSLLIMAQKPEATRIMEFDDWKSKGGYIKPDEKHISILERYEYTKKDDGSKGYDFNVKKVFDISQINPRRMKPEPAPPTLTDRQKVQALVLNAPVKITGVDTLPDDVVAQTNPETGEIQIRKDVGFSATFGSLAKELASAEIYDNTATLVDKDFSAYCVSYMLCKKYGADTEQFSFDDVDKVFEGLEAKEVKGEIQLIRDTFTEINIRMSKQLEAQQQQSKAAKNNEAR